MSGPVVEAWIPGVCYDVTIRFCIHVRVEVDMGV